MSNAWVFLEPLTDELWVTSGVFFTFTGIVVWILEHRINPEFRGHPSEQLGTICYFAFSTMVFAHQKKNKNSSKFVGVFSPEAYITSPLLRLTEKEQKWLLLLLLSQVHGRKESPAWDWDVSISFLAKNTCQKNELCHCCLDLFRMLYQK